jgi:hypothetical protein
VNTGTLNNEHSNNEQLNIELNPHSSSQTPDDYNLSIVHTFSRYAFRIAYTDSVYLLCLVFITEFALLLSLLS